ncbi:MAG: PucR family transcriptional regulator ligand-binding domain-containing protein [Paenibacillus sp.]|uniref:PucR family transcriptional regulator n=1 Tax=Paenibacillus sp. TaxID=58172 RepID=UPI002902EFDE|nr:PucR family transcriptional regulator ligand-binding domain-containing protein [Paenibacillus sp.]MDU2240051.1 PucR family transcriptional regulator ligand-binding domain-containing protein [Paenibacillus sp.]
MEFACTVREAVSRPLFADARVVAGECGLGRAIRWVHVLESANFDSLIHGEEMILTTGVGIAADGLSPVHFLEKLIRKNAACLCIEIGTYFKELPEGMAELADRHDFPLILFARTVRFVDITLDLHSLILSRRHRTLQQVETRSREFNRLSLGPQGTQKIVQLLHNSTGHAIVYAPLNGKPLYCPALPSEEQQPMLDLIAELHESGEAYPGLTEPALREWTQGATLLLKPTGALEQTWAYLIMVCRQKPQEVDALLLDSASLSIAQELLRTRYMEERKRFSENRWVADVLAGRLEDEKQLGTLLGPQFHAVNDSHYYVCLLEFASLQPGAWSGPDPEWETNAFHLSLILRSALEKCHFRPLMTLHHNRLAVIALDLKPKQQGAVPRLRQALEPLQQLRHGDLPKDQRPLIGVSAAHTRLKEAPAAYQEAGQSLSLQSVLREPLIFYEELGIYQLLLHLNDGRTLQAFVRSYLGPLIDYDQAKGSELLLTLRVYLDHDGSKQVAARKLFIVRQSLYYRLEKITELLGDDFMAPENRISIQVALRAYQLLYPDKLTPAEARSSHV